MVDELHQKKGIGNSVTKELINCFIKKDVHVISCVAWRHDEVENIGGIMRQLGFKKNILIKKYWEKESLEEQFDCPICGKPPCLCDANIYFKSF